MKTRLAPAVFAFAVLLFQSQTLAAESAASVVSTDLRTELVDPNAPEAAMVRRIGEAAINWLGARLVHEVNTALMKGGPESAVAICHLKNIAAGGQALSGMPSIKAVKRTSLQLLNAANAPDAADQLVLNHVDRLLRRNETPHELLIQRITAPNGAVEWRVYRPLAVLPSCLACHGDPATQSPALQTLLREKAPANAAFGYSAGDWRGLLRVTVAPPAPEK